MLQSLHIQNYALIENLTIDLAKGFIVLTGETGAGKSIILGALGLLLGERANLSSIGNTEKKCIVEGSFDISKYALQNFFEQEDIDYEQLTIIRRELSPSGKSRAFINDTPVTLAVVRSLTSQLVDIHSQHQNLAIETESFQFQLVDSFAQNQKEKTDYLSAFQKLQKLQQDKEALLSSQQQQNSDMDYWQFQLEELKTANLKIEEQEALETENLLFSQLEQIQEALAQTDAFFNAEPSPIEDLQRLAARFRQLREVYAPSQTLEERLQSSYIELKDIAQEVATEIGQLQNDPERANYVNERLDTIYKLQQKHGKSTIAELLNLQEKLEEKINAVQNFAEHLESIEKAVKAQTSVANQKAHTLSETRKRVTPQIEKEIVTQLHMLGMPHAKITLQLETTQHLRPQGKEQLSIQFSANKNMPLANISEVASGGELSRLMLTIKQILAKSLVLPTLIFDEIDTGVSGEIADKMGEMMQSMAKQMQVIAISHLPQIAAKASQHWQVYKQDTTEKTITAILQLEQEARVEALAKMLSGSKLTNEALANARVLLEES